MILEKQYLIDDNLDFGELVPLLQSRMK